MNYVPSTKYLYFGSLLQNPYTDINCFVTFLFSQLPPVYISVTVDCIFMLPRFHYYVKI